MKKDQQKLYFILGTGLLLLSCSGEKSTSAVETVKVPCTELKLSEDDLSWFDCYEVNQTTFFINQFDDVDTFTVVEKENRNLPCFGKNQEKFSTNSFHVEMINKNVKSVIEDDVLLYDCLIKHPDSASIMDFYVFDFTCRIHDIENLTKTSVAFKHLDEDTIECFYFEKPLDRTLGDGNDRVTEFYWNKEYGLIKYVMYDSLIYELYKVVL